MSLTPYDLSAIGRIATRIIPSDTTPGAADAPVVDMIADVVASWPAERQEQFTGGLDLSTEFAIASFGGDLLALSDADFDSLIEQLAHAPEWAAFWFGLRSLVVLNFYGLPVGYVPLGFPGPNIDAGGFTADGEPV